MNTKSVNISNWLDTFFTAYYNRRPVNATFIGMHEMDHQLPDFSEKGAGETVDEMTSLLQRLEKLPAENLSAAENLDRMLAAGYLQNSTLGISIQSFSPGKSLPVYWRSSF